MTDSRATLPEILTFPDKSGESIGIHKRIGAKYKTFGIILLNDSDVGQWISSPPVRKVIQRISTLRY